MTAAALTAPLALSGPVESEAATPTAVDTLLNHPEWRIPLNDPAIAEEVTAFKHFLATRQGSTDPNRLMAYAVPTVEGIVRYVTANPASFHVTVNPDRLHRFPINGVAGELETRFGTAVPDANGEYATVAVPTRTGAGGIPKVFVEFDNLDQSLAQLTKLAQAVIQFTTDPATLAYLAQEIEEQSVKIGGDEPTVPDISTVTALVDGLLLLVADLLNDPPVTPPTTGELIEAVNRLIAEVDAARKALVALLPEVDPETEGDVVYDVVPTAAATAMPVNSEINATSPQSEPLWQPVDGAMALSPEAQAIVGPERSTARWKRNSDDCFLASSSAWYRQICWNIDHQSDDESSTYSYWQLNLEGSSYPKNGRGMYRTWVEGKPHTGSGVATQFFDGSLPKPNQEVGGEDGCTQRSEGIQVSGGKPIQFGFGYDFSVTTCEIYTPRGYDDQGHWSNKWHYNSDRNPKGVGYGSGDAHMRNVALTMGVKTTSTDKYPSWSYLTGTHVSKQCWYC